ncbi:MAG: 30S ribosomal protein S18 [Candidatus Andersenbacteria bacterium]|nr:30S ribosomal protein S18 [Candidatus Andersenbacteria bacterium]
MKKTRTISTVCILCSENLSTVTFRDTEMLRRFTSGQNKILPRRKTGSCAKHQRMISREVKRARELGVLSQRGQ